MERALGLLLEHSASTTRRKLRRVDVIIRDETPEPIPVCPFEKATGLVAWLNLRCNRRPLVWLRQ